MNIKKTMTLNTVLVVATCICGALSVYTAREHMMFTTVISTIIAFSLVYTLHGLSITKLFAMQDETFCVTHYEKGTSNTITRYNQSMEKQIKFRTAVRKRHYLCTTLVTVSLIVEGILCGSVILGALVNDVLVVVMIALQCVTLFGYNCIIKRMCNEMQTFVSRRLV